MWIGKFDRDTIENLTKKTGSAKKFNVFIKMLHSALDQTSESVLVDILTPRDLELLRDRKQREAQFQGGDGNLQGKLDDSKMFVILTYICEFEKVHYPLCLSKSIPKEQQLLQTINALRQELAATKSNTTANNSMLGSLAHFTVGVPHPDFSAQSSAQKPSPILQNSSPPFNNVQLQQQAAAQTPSAASVRIGVLEQQLSEQHEQHKHELAVLFAKIDALEAQVRLKDRIIADKDRDLLELRKHHRKNSTDIRDRSASKDNVRVNRYLGERSGSNSQKSNSAKKPKLPMTKTYNYMMAKPKLPTAPVTKPAARHPTPKKAPVHRSSPSGVQRNNPGYLPAARRSQDSFNSRDSGEMKSQKGGSRKVSRSNSVSSLSHKGLNTSNGSLKKPRSPGYRNSPKLGGIRHNSPGQKRPGSPFRFQDTRDMFRSDNHQRDGSDGSDSRERRKRARQMKDIDNFHLNRPVVQTQPTKHKSALKAQKLGYPVVSHQESEEVDQDLFEIHQKFEKLSKALASGTGKN